MKIATAFLLLALSPARVFAQDGCSAATLFPDLDESYHRCRNRPNDSSNGNWDCDRFLENMRKALVWEQCPTPFWDPQSKSEKSPLLWVMGTPNGEDYVELLSRMKSKEARCLLSSKAFSDALSIAVDPSETYGDDVRRAQKQMMGKCATP